VAARQTRLVIDGCSPRRRRVLREAWPRPRQPAAWGATHAGPHLAQHELGRIDGRDLPRPRRQRPSAGAMVRWCCAGSPRAWVRRPPSSAASTATGTCPPSGPHSIEKSPPPSHRAGRMPPDHPDGPPPRVHGERDSSCDLSAALVATATTGSSSSRHWTPTPTSSPPAPRPSECESRGPLSLSGEANYRSQPTTGPATMRQVRPLSITVAAVSRTRADCPVPGAAGDLSAWSRRRRRGREAW
jgi:hypothetical protein